MTRSPPSPSAASPSKDDKTPENNAEHAHDETDAKEEKLQSQAGDEEQPAAGGAKEDDTAPVAGSSKDGAEATTSAPAQNEWQAIWSPQFNAYYFFNTRTQESTWTNPLVPPEAQADGAPSSAGPSTAPSGAAPASSAEPPAATSTVPTPAGLAIDEAALNGIDPALAYLEPTLYAARPGGAPPNTFTAKFNARTGKFSTDARDPSYLSEAERAKRMSSVFFDVDAWEKEVAARKAADDAKAGDKRKKPSKGDLERWAEAKKRKKLAKHAWLLN